MAIFAAKFGFQRTLMSCTPEALLDLESKLPGGSLPVDYRAFLQEWNGGRFKAFTTIAFPLKDDEFEFGRVSQFFGLFNAENGNDLRRSSIGYGFADAVFERFLAIGCSGFFARIALSVTGNDRGAIYYWDPGEPWPGDQVPKDSLLRPVAANFSDFWDSLFEATEEL